MILFRCTHEESHQNRKRHFRQPPKPSLDLLHPAEPAVNPLSLWSLLLRILRVVPRPRCRPPRSAFLDWIFDLPFYPHHLAHFTVERDDDVVRDLRRVWCVEV
jgi:hypothetical protein